MVKICLALSVFLSGPLLWAKPTIEQFATLDRSYFSSIILAEQENRRIIDKFGDFQKNWHKLNKVEKGNKIWDEHAKKISERIINAEKAIQKEEWLKAHSELLPIRSVLIKYRQKAGIDYYPDYLAYFQDVIEPMILKAQMRMQERRPVNMNQVFEDHYEEAAAVWSVVKEMPFSPKAFGFNEEREGFLKNSINDMTEALYSVLKAYRYGSGEDLARAMLELEPTYYRFFFIFSDLDVPKENRPNS